MWHLKRFYTISESLRISLYSKVFLDIEIHFSNLPKNNLSTMVF